MTVSEAQPLPPAQAEPVNSFARIGGVFVAPTRTFESIARKPDVLVPLIILLLVSLVSGLIVASKVDFPSLAREAMEQNPRFHEMATEQADRMVKMTSGIMRATSYAQPFLALFIWAIVAGVLLIAFRMFGGEGDYKTAFSVTIYAWYIQLVKGILAMIVIISRRNLTMIDLQNPIRSNLGFLVNPKTQQIPFAVLSSIDIFSIWFLVVLIIGCAAFSRLSRARSAAIVISLWFVTLLFKVGGAALGALKAKG